MAAIPPSTSAPRFEGRERGELAGHHRQHQVVADGRGHARGRRPRPIVLSTFHPRENRCQTSRRPHGDPATCCCAHQVGLVVEQHCGALGEEGHRGARATRAGSTRTAGGAAPRGRGCRRGRRPRGGGAAHRLPPRSPARHRSRRRTVRHLAPGWAHGSGGGRRVRRTTAGDRMSIVSKPAKTGAAKKPIRPGARSRRTQAKAKDLLNKVKDKRRPAGQPWAAGASGAADRAPRRRAGRCR